MKQKLSAAFMATVRPEPGARKTTYYDTVTIGLIAEVRAGSATYSLRYTDSYGRQRQHKIGAVGDISFDKARKEAIRLKSQIVLGGDPMAAKAEKKTILTYAELAKLHIEHARTYARSIKNIEGYVDNHLLPKWGKMRINEISQRDVALWLAEKDAAGFKPATVEKLRIIFGRAFELAIRWDLPGAGKNPTRGIKRAPINNARQRYLTAEEAARLGKAMAESSNPQLKNICGLLLLTAARKSELLNAKWEHVDVERGLWFIPRTKNGHSRHVPLPTAALAIIAKLPRFNGCEWLLPNPSTRKPFVSIKRAWATATKAAGLEGFRPHDSRHAAISAMVSSGVPIQTAGTIAGHRNIQSTQRYSHLSSKHLLDAVEAGAAGLGIDWA